MIGSKLFVQLISNSKTTTLQFDSSLISRINIYLQFFIIAFSLVPINTYVVRQGLQVSLQKKECWCRYQTTSTPKPDAVAK